MNQKGFILTAFLCMIFVYAEMGGKSYSDYWYLREGETMEQALYKDYGLKIENGKLLWYDPRVPPHPDRRVMGSEAYEKYSREYRLKKRPYPHKVITNAIISFGRGYYGNAYPSVKESRERKYTVTVEDYLIQRGCKTRIRLFYRLTEKKELEFSEDKKTWEKVKVELVYEDFTLEKDPPRDEDDPNDTSSIFFKLRISCKWFDEVFCRTEPSL